MQIQSLFVTAVVFSTSSPTSLLTGYSVSISSSNIEASFSSIHIFCNMQANVINLDIKSRRLISINFNHLKRPFSILKARSITHLVELCITLYFVFCLNVHYLYMVLTKIFLVDKLHLLINDNFQVICLCWYIIHYKWEFFSVYENHLKILANLQKHQ